MNGVEQWKAVPEYQPTYGFFGEKTGQKITGYHKGEMIYDGKPEVLADAVSSIYQTLMQKCWKLVDSQEVVDLKATAKEIRDRATYQAKPSG
jgi:hypothetical protein